MDKNLFYKLLRKIPKPEIHLHCEGVISKQTAREFLMRDDPKYRSLNEVKKLFNYSNLSEFIQTFLLIQRSYKNVKDFKKLFIDVALYLKKNGIVYSEIFLSPSQFLKIGMQFDEVLDAISNEIKKIKKKYRITLKIIIDVSRTFGIENAMNNLDLVLKKRRNCIIGIGLGGDESKGPAREFESVFKKAKEAGLHTVAHAGEDVGPDSIWDAINILKSERIGHGITAIQDKALIEYLKLNSIPLEINPTSNLFTKFIVKTIEEHPIKPFYDAGVMVTLNTDDPTFFNVDLIDEYWSLYNNLGFTLCDIKQIIINGFKATFLPENIKRKYIKLVEKRWKDTFGRRCNLL